MLRLSPLLFVLVAFTQSAIAEQAGPGAKEPASPAAWYGEGVRPTDARTPEEERAGFHVPEGFVVELVASEPDITKPLNMAFDSQGRLWVTCTVEYPYPASAGQTPRDTIRVLEDLNGDGRSDKSTLFAEQLNIPMGLLPYADGAIVFDIPQLYRLRDQDHDGVCDAKEPILGPFDTTRDTHGMINALRRGDDGWIYACHGFNNQSRVVAKDGSVVEMQSGNTFRFRPDGSRIEHETHGQVNPFGMVIDRWGNRFTADCHSKPITQLLRGGYYSSFGRPDDGLGFVPSMMEHLHGSTAISGLAIYEAHGYPEAYRDQIYSGNVMTSRINRNQMVRHGATYRAEELSDFLTSDDPWFRPVDIQLGPDGALYIADFYNKIIGHYEVPLEHPGRDRERGRIWRVVYRGDATIAVKSPKRSATIDDELKQLSDDNTSNARMALQRLADRNDQESLVLLRQRINDHDPRVRVGSLWALHQRGAITMEALHASAKDDEAFVRVHAWRALREQPNWDAATRTLAIRALDDSDARVVREAVEGLGKHADASVVQPLMTRLVSVDSKDMILRQALRIALRDAFAQDSIAERLQVSDYLAQPKIADEFASVLLGLRSPAAGRWLMAYLESSKRPLLESLPTVKHIAQSLDAATLPEFIQYLKGQTEDWQLQRTLLQTLQDSSAGAALASQPAVRDWSEALTRQWLAKTLQTLDEQPQVQVPWTSESGSPWSTQNRAAEDGVNDQAYYSSFTRGETYTGTMRSGSFKAPERLKFWIVGHNGLPSTSDTKQNLVRLVDEQSGNAVREALPPRCDVARLVDWDLKEVQGKPVHFECIDGDTHGAYAWIAFGRFDHGPLQSNAFGDSLREGLESLTKWKVHAVREEIFRLSSHEKLDHVAQLQCLKAWASLSNEKATEQLAQMLLAFRPSSDAVTKLRTAAQEGKSSGLGDALVKPLATAMSLDDQRRLAKLLATSRESFAWMLKGVNEGYIAPEVLREKDIQQATDTLANAEQQATIKSVLASLPSADSATEKLATQLIASLREQPCDAVQGAALFKKHCAICHQLAGEGTLIGPQLDGAVVRGAARLLEDVLFPDRNVDRAFRTTTFLLTDGSVRSGLIRGESATEIELIENNGQLLKLDPQNIEERKASTRSLMPGGLQNTVGEQGLRDLLTYLTSFQPPANAAANRESTAQQNMPRAITLPTIDLSMKQELQTIVDREPGVYLGHPTTVLLEDGKTILCVYPRGHGRGPITYKRSGDGGKNWSDRIPVPENWSTSLETPTIHRVVDAAGRKRLIVWSGLYPARLAVSEDDGATWSPLKEAGAWGGIVVMGSVEPLKTPGHYLALFHDDGRFFTKTPQPKKPVEFTMYQSNSTDGGLTWSPPRTLFTRSDVHLCEPGSIRSPDGKQIAVLLRENRRARNSFVIFSNDEGATWSEPKELPASLTGDRHTLKYLKDGRLFASFRDMAHESPWRGDWVAWVGHYDDLAKGNEGALRLRLMDNTQGTDCAYPGVEVLPDGTVVTTTYGHWTQGEKPYIVTVRLSSIP